MEKHSTRTLSINDFREWYEASVLVLAPKFQRRSVWPDKARSYLIDTVLRDLPMPKLFMRQEIDDSGRTIREIVDGQQRIRTVLAYIENGFPVMHVCWQSAEWDTQFPSQCDFEIKLPLY
jgi:uncharacterized protein with ParB-like and HNH nuclease domain